MWTKAHVSLTQKVLQNTKVEVTNLPIIPYFGKFWGFDGRKDYEGESVTPSLRNGSAYLGNGMYAEFMSVLGHICNWLFSIGENGFRTRKMTSLYKLFRKYQDPERKFQ